MLPSSGASALYREEEEVSKFEKGLHTTTPDPEVSGRFLGAEGYLISTPMQHDATPGTPGRRQMNREEIKIRRWKIRTTRTSQQLGRRRKCLFFLVCIWCASKGDPGWNRWHRHRIVWRCREGHAGALWTWRFPGSTRAGTPSALAFPCEKHSGTLQRDPEPN